jgi:molybdopterin synthase sulfur carrier subunit
MTVQIRIPSALRAQTDGLTCAEVEARDVAEALRRVQELCPALTPILCDDTGAIRPRVNVYVNDVHVRFGRGMDTPLQDGDQVYIVPLVMGG